MYLLNPEEAGQLGWRKARKSDTGGECVEVADTGSGVAVRHSKNPGGPALLYTRDEFAAFLDGAKQGEFDDFC